MLQTPGTGFRLVKAVRGTGCAGAGEEPSVSRSRQGRSASASCGLLGTAAAWVWTPLRMETPRPLWATNASVWPASRVKNKSINLIYKYIWVSVVRALPLPAQISSGYKTCFVFLLGHLNSRQSHLPLLETWAVPGVELLFNWVGKSFIYLLFLWPERIGFKLWYFKFSALT